MKYISRLLILCFLLVGCAREENVEPVFTPVETVVVPGLYDAGSDLEISSMGAIRVFPISPRSGKALLPFGQGILMFSGGERTTLTLFTGETCVPTARKSLDFCLEAENCTLREEGLSYYDPIARCTLVLDCQLEAVQQIPAPGGMVGEPVLSPDGATLYYCTADGVRGWDLHTNIHRILRQTESAWQSAGKLYCHGAVLACRTEDEILFLSTETGQLLSREGGDLKLVTHEEGYIAATWETNVWSLLFQTKGETKALTPRNLSAEYFLLEQGVVTAAASADVVTLDHYDLVTGKRRASQMIRGSIPQAVTEKDGALWLLMYLPEYGGQAILRWDPGKSVLSDQQIYTGPHFSEKQPDLEGLKKCQAYADQIGQRYGIRIYLWQDVLSLAPEGVAVKPEHRVNILMRELELLDRRLSQFPEGLLQTTATNFDSFNIGLAAQISGSVQSQSLQQFAGQTADILLAVGDDSEAALYHELFHVMQTHILSHSSALDQWSTLNPQGFQYDYDYAANRIRNSGIYLTEENRFFIDTFSMSYPKEDQARIFEYAMIPGQESLFQRPNIRKKLKAICSGIRDAYDLPAEGQYPWEQYLQ